MAFATALEKPELRHAFHFPLSLLLLVVNASPSTSTCKNPDSAQNRTAWTHARASAANAVGMCSFLYIFVFNS
ncbi:hypothetical protein ES288_A04G079300v1 [Gossypium darwinii]|uniref:Uncharacterized protein n=1 Tax=Gossypium darwinii TaxID=34276 RepID=A0A5D2GVF0_GOSDA|nr:hypothetical protein ES288_A04G079300v1 [Gossypium darwinii]